MNSKTPHALLLTTTAFAVASIIGYVFVAAGAISLSWAKLSFRSERSISFGNEDAQRQLQGEGGVFLHQRTCRRSRQSGRD